MLSTFSSQERTETNFPIWCELWHVNRKMDVADFTKCISLIFKTSVKKWKFFFPGYMKLV